MFIERGYSIKVYDILRHEDRYNFPILDDEVMEGFNVFVRNYAPKKNIDVISLL